MPLPGSVATVTVGGTVEHPTTGQLATGTVKFELPAALATSEGYVLGDAVPASYAVANGVFVNPPVLPANDSTGLVPQGWTYKVTVATDVWAAVFYASLPTSPATTTLAALYAQRATAPVAGTSYVPLSAVGVTVAPLVDEVVPSRYRPSTFAGLTDVDVTGVTDGQVPAWNTATSKWTPQTPAGGGGGTSFAPVYVSSGPQTGTFGGGTGGVQPTGIPPSMWRLTLPADKVAAGHLLQWSMPLISTGGDAQCDLASLVAGAPVNFYSDHYGPVQNPNGHSGLYVAGDFGADQGPVIWWVVQPTDLDEDGTFTISFAFQPSGSHRWGSDTIPGQVDLVNFGPTG
jgi:hypothetical protein